MMRATPWATRSMHQPHHMSRSASTTPMTPRPQMTTWRSRSARNLLRTVERRERQRQQHFERLEREQERLAEERRDLAKKALEGDAAALASAGRGMGRGRGGVSNLPAWMKAAATEAAAAEKPPGAGRDCDQEKIKADARAAAAELGGRRRRLRTIAGGDRFGMWQVRHGGRVPCRRCIRRRGRRVYPVYGAAGGGQGPRGSGR